MFKKEKFFQTINVIFSPVHLRSFPKKSGSVLRETGRFPLKTTTGRHNGKTQREGHNGKMMENETCHIYDG